MEDDPEFLELSIKQRRAIDRAFERGIRATRGRPSKRRRLNRTSETSTPVTPADGGFVDDSGGFIDDGGGGFMPDDDAGGFIADDGGGFLPDDDAGGFVPDDDDCGGFVPDENGPSAGPSAGPSTAGDTRATSPTDERLPLRLMPSLLSNLGLPSDEDVLGVFRAIGESDGSGSASGGVRLKDFRAVCAALMPPDDGDDDDQGEDEDDDGEEEEGGGYEDDDVEMSSGTEDEFEPSDDDEYGAAPIKRTSKRKARREVLEETAAPKLSSRQREAARAIWALLKPDSSGPGSGILSRDEVKRWARELGEMWSDQEITDMVQLFSGQHEGRGLTFEDFGVVMLRAGLV